MSFLISYFHKNSEFDKDKINAVNLIHKICLSLIESKFIQTCLLCILSAVAVPGFILWVADHRNHRNIIKEN